jgi:hypothetical protein
VVDRSARRWNQTSPKNVNMDSSDENAFVRIMYFLDEMISKVFHLLVTIETFSQNVLIKLDGFDVIGLIGSSASVSPFF